jgi:hypothetical protein
MPAITAPVTHAATYGTTGHAAVFAQAGIQRKLVEMINALGLGIVTLYGDLMGQGSDTLKITNVDGIGFAEGMTTMAGETDEVAPTGFTLDADTMSIARHALAKEMSYQYQMANAGRREAVSWDQLIAALPESWLRTLISKICTTGATITDASGTTNTVWDLDAELALLTAFQTTEGAMDAPIITVRHPIQYSQLRDSLRDEGALQNAGDFERLQGVGNVGVGRPGGDLNGFLGLNNFSSHRVSQSGVDRIGFAYNAGKLGWCVSSTNPIVPANPAGVIYVPQFGLIIEHNGSSGQAITRADANAWFGTGKLGDGVRYGRRIVSRAS